MSTPTKPSTFLDRDNWIRAVLASDLPHVAVRLAVRIAHHLHVGTGRCDPSYAALAAGSRIAERSVYRLVALLEHTGWLGVQRTRGRHANQYMLLNPASPTTGLNPAKAMTGLNPANPDSGDNPTLPNRASNPANMVADKKRRKAKRKAKGKKDSLTDFFAGEKKEAATEGSKQEKNEADGAFDRFWSVFPRHDAEEPARKAFARAVDAGTDPAVIVEGAKRYAIAEQIRLARPDQSSQHTAMAKNWLRERRWNDPPPPRPGGPPTIDNETGKEVPTPRPRSNGSSSWLDNAAAVASWMKFGAVS
jgi:hypothetical protein